MLIFSITYNVGKINKKTFKKVLQYIILYYIISATKQTKEDLQMRLTTEQIFDIEELESRIDLKVQELHELKTLEFRIREAHNLYEIIEGLWDNKMAEEFEDKKAELEDRINDLESDIEELEQDIEDIREGSNSEWQNREYESQLL